MRHWLAVHRARQHRQAATQSVEQPKSSAALDVADCHFHCQCVVDTPASMVMPIVIGHSRPTAWTEADAIAPVLARPERPQWVDHA